MSGIRRLSDAALSGAAGGASSGQVPTKQASGRFTPAAGISDNPIYSTHNLTPPSLKYSRAALARCRAGTGDFRMAVSGDSIANGGNATTPLTENFARKAAVALGLKQGISSVRQGLIPIKYFGSVMSQWTVGADWSNWGHLLDSTGDGYIAASGTSTTLDFVPTDDAGVALNTDSFIIYAWTGGGATPPQWAIDGGSYTALSSAGSLGARFGGGGGITRYSVSAGARGLHTLHLKAAASGSATLVLGAEAVDSTTRGIRWITGGTQGSVTPSGTSSWANGPAYDAFRPDLMMFEWNINDYGLQTALATFQANVQSMMPYPGTYMTQPADCLWLGAPWQNAGALAIPQQTYFDTLDAASDLQGVPILHLDRWLVSFAAANASPISFYGDTIHPNTAGHNAWGSMIASILGLL